MGVGKVVDADSEPLLAHPVVVAAEEAQLLDGSGFQPVAARRWEGGLLQCCGACDLVGWGSCLLSRYLPCVAFGYNSRRGFRQSAWLHGLAYLALFGLAYWVAAGAVGAAQHNVLATCNGRLPHPPRRHHGPHGFDPQFLPEPAFQALGSRDPQQLDGLFAQPLPQSAFEGFDVVSEDDDDDGGKHGKHHHENDDDDDNKHDHGKKGGKGLKKPCKKGRKILPGQPTPLDVLPASSASFESASGFVGRKGYDEWGSNFDNDDEIFASPECQQAVALYFGAWALAIVSALVAVHYAARRRTHLRERFGIAGSRMGDFCSWLWCGSCALCQETRTLWANVHEGVWYGPAQFTQLPAATIPVQPPPAQFMSSAAGTVRA